MTIKTLAELYGYKKSCDSRTRKMNVKRLRRFIMSEANMILREQEEKKEEKPVTDGLVDVNDGPDAVLAAIPKLAEDPDLEAILNAGTTDEAGPSDEMFEVVSDTVKASELSPTQSQVGAGQSLDDQAADKYGNLDRAIAGGKIASKSGVFPILVYGNEILDGHHRWSQFITTNPDADVDVARIQAPGVNDADGALGLAHFINFALYGKSPTKDFEGDNVYTLDKKAIYHQALENMADTTPGKLMAAGLIEEETPEAAAEHFATNLSAIPGPGSHPRTSMPQPADAGDPTGLTKTPAQGAAGEINYLAPQKGDNPGVRESHRSHDDRILERWQRMAGLL